MIVLPEKGGGVGNGGRRAGEHPRKSFPAPNRNALNGMGEFLLTQVRRGASEQQWADWLKVPFEHACLAWDMSTIKRLLEAGVNGPYDRPRDPRLRRHTLLHLSAACGNTEVVNTLLRWGSAPDVACREPGEKAYTPLHRAALGGHGELSRVLIKAGADKNARTGGSGASPLHLAARRGHEDCVRILLLIGAEKDARRALDGATPLHQASFFGQMGAVRELLEAVANPNAQDAEGCTPVFLAAQEGHEEVVVDLLRNGASPDICREDGWTPLHAAARFGHTSTVMALLREGQADFEAHTGDHGSTPLHVAAISGFDEVIGVLMDIGSNLEALDSGGWTPLHCACAAARASCVNALLQRGADPSALTPDGQRPPSLIATDLAEGDELNEETNQTILKMLRIPRVEFEARRRRHVAKHSGGMRPPPPYNNRPPPAYGPESAVGIFDSGGSGSGTRSVSGSYSGEGSRQQNRSPTELKQQPPMGMGTGFGPSAKIIRRGGAANGPVTENIPSTDNRGLSRGHGSGRVTPRGGETGGGFSNKSKRPSGEKGSDGAPKILSCSVGGGGGRGRRVVGGGGGRGAPPCEERPAERTGERSTEPSAQRQGEEQGGAVDEAGRPVGYGYNAALERPPSHDNRASTGGVVAYPLRRSPKNESTGAGAAQPHEAQAKERPRSPPDTTKKDPERPLSGGRSKSPPDSSGSGSKQVASSVVQQKPRSRSPPDAAGNRTRAQSRPERVHKNLDQASSGSGSRSPPDGSGSRQRGAATAQQKPRSRSPPDAASLKPAESRPRLPATEAAVKRIRARQQEQQQRERLELEQQHKEMKHNMEAKSPKMQVDGAEVTPKVPISASKDEESTVRFAGDGSGGDNGGIGGEISSRNSEPKSEGIAVTPAKDVAEAGGWRVTANGGKHDASSGAAAGNPERPGGEVAACRDKEKSDEDGKEGLPRLLSRPSASLRVAAAAAAAAAAAGGGVGGTTGREATADMGGGRDKGGGGGVEEGGRDVSETVRGGGTAESSMLHDGRRSSAGRVSGAFDSGISMDISSICSEDRSAGKGSDGVGSGIGNGGEAGGVETVDGSGDASNGIGTGGAVGSGNGNGTGTESGGVQGGSVGVGRASRGLGSSNGIGAGSGIGAVSSRSSGRRDVRLGSPTASINRIPSFRGIGNGTATASSSSSSRPKIVTPKGLVAQRLAALDPFSYSQEDAASSARPAPPGKSKSFRARS